MKGSETRLSSGTAQKASSTANSSRDKMDLSNLPAEVHLQILSELPVVSVHRMREVNHYFHDVIDDNEVLNYDAATTNFFDAFINFIHHRGIAYQDIYSTEFHPFVDRWLDRVRGINPCAVVSVDPGELCDANRLVSEFALAYLSRLVRKSRYNRRIIPLVTSQMESHLTAARTRGADLLGLSRDDVQGFYNKIQDMPKSEVQSRVTEQRLKRQHPKFSDWRPDWPLTQLDGRMAYRKYPEKFARMDGIMSVNDVAEMLGVPTWPNSVPPFRFFSDDPPLDFGYCVETERTYDIVRKAMADSRHLTQAEKASVLEELFVF